MAHTRTNTALAYLQDRPLTPVARIALVFAATCVAYAERRKSRIALGKLDDHLLRDIGLTHHQARREATRPFWQI